MIRRIGAIALLVAVAVVGWSPASAAQPDEAVMVLARTIELVERARGAGGQQRQALLAEARQTLEVHAELRVPWLLDPLTEGDLDRATGRLRAAQAAVEPVGAPPQEPFAAARTLEDILAGPPFRSWSWLALLPAVLLPIGLLLQTVLDAIWNAMRWPFDRLLELLNRLFGGLFYTPVVLLLAALATFGLIWLYRRGLRSAIVAQAEITADRAVLPLTSAAAMATAQRHAAAGAYRDACHFVFFATLRWLEEQGEARFVPAATNREYLSQIEAQPRVASALAPVVSLFDRLWYGQDDVVASDYQALLTAAGRVREVGG